MLANGGWDLIQRLTLTLLTWTIWRAPTNASKWRMGFNSAFKGLIYKTKEKYKLVSQLGSVQNSTLLHSASNL